MRAGAAWWRNLALAAAVTAACLAALEGLAVYYVSSVLHYPRLYQWDRLLGWRLKQNLDVRRAPEGLFSYGVRTDDDGLRFPAIDVAWDDSAYRVLILGDSFAFGQGVEIEDRFDRAFGGRTLGGRPVAVINSGVGGYSTDQQLLYLEQRGIGYRPDLILLLSYENDLVEIVYDIASSRRKPRYLLEPGGLRLTGVPVPRTSWLRSHSYLCGFLVARLFRDRRDPEAIDRDQASALFLALRAEIARVAHDHGALFVQALASYKTSLAGGELDWKRRVLAAREGPDLVIDLDPAFLAAPERERLYFENDHHWSPDGHRLAGRVLVEALARWLGD